MTHLSRTQPPTFGEDADLKRVKASLRALVEEDHRDTARFAARRKAA
jgi:hypothetical protein